MSAVTVAVNLVGNNYTAGAFGALGNEMAILGSRAQTLANYLSRLGTGTKAAAGAALVGAAAFALFKAPLAAGVSGAMDLEAQLLKLRQAAQANQDAIPVLTQSINDLGIKTVFSSSEAAQAFTLLIKSGFDVSQVMYGMGAATDEYKQHAYDAKEATHGLGFEALALGQLLGVSATDGANLAATAIHQWANQIQASNNPTAAASRIVNDLAGAYQNVSTSGGDMLRFLDQAGPTASALGIRFQDLMTTADVLGQHFGSLDIVGTRLRYFMQTLIHPTAAQAQELAHLGLQSINATSAYRAFEAQLVRTGAASSSDIKVWDGSVAGLQKMFKAAQAVGMVPLDTNFSDWAIQTGFLNQKIYDSHGNLKSLKDIIDTLNTSLAGMSTQEKNAALSNLFNVRGGDIGRMVAALSDFDAQYSKVMGRIKNTDAVKQAMEALGTLKGAWEALKDSVKSALAVAFINLLPVITGFVNVLNNLVGAFLNMPPQIQTALGVFLIVGTVLSGLVMVVGGAIAVIGLLAPAFTALGLTSGALAPVLAGVAGALVGIPAIAAAVFLAFSAGGSITDRLRAAWDALRSHIGPVVGLLAGVASAAFLVFGGHMGTAMAIMSAFLGPLGALGRGFLSLFTTLTPVRTILSGLGILFSPLGAAARLVATGFSNLAPIIGTLVGWFRSLGPILQTVVLRVATLVTSAGGLSGIWATVSGAVSSAAGALAAFLAPAAAIVGVALLIAGAVAGVVLTFQHWWATSAQFRSIITDLLSRFQALGSLLMGQLRQAWAGIQAAMQSLQPTLAQVGQLWETLKPVLMVVGAIIIGVLVVAVGVLIAVLRGLIMAIGPVVSGLAAAFAGIVQIVMGIVQVIVGLLGALVGLVRGIFTGDWTGLQSSLHTLWTGVQNIVSGLVHGVIGLFGGLLGGVVGALSGFVGGVISWFTHLWDTLVGHSIVPDMINAIVNWFLRLPGMVLGAIAGFVSQVITQFSQLAVRALAAINLLVNTAIALFLSWGARGLAAVTAMVAAIISTVLRLEAMVLSGISRMVSMFLAFLGSMASGGISRVASMVGSILGAIGNLVGQVVGRAASMAGQFVGRLASMAGQAIGQVRSMGGQIVGAVSGLAGQLASAGRNMIQGLINGIRSMAGAAVGAAKGVVGSAISGAKALLGIRSPSKVFEEIGHFTVAGYVNAMVSGKDQVQKAVNLAFSPSVPTNTLTPGLAGLRSSLLAATNAGNKGTVVIQNQLNGKLIGETVLDLATLQLRQVGTNRMGR